MSYFLIKEARGGRLAALIMTPLLLTIAFQGNADVITFDDAVAGSSAYAFDGNSDGIPDLTFSTEASGGFNTIGPGLNQAYIEEPGLETTTLLRRDLKVTFHGGATGQISFGFALNSSVSHSDYKVGFELYDENDNLLASDFAIGQFTATPFGTSSFPEGRVTLSFPGTAAYGIFRATSEFGRFIIDNFEGTFAYAPGVSRDIMVFPTFAPYDGELITRGMPGITATFGYTFSGTEIAAELLIRDNKTLADAAASRGFEYFNFVQLVTSFPPFSGCLSNVPFLDAPMGGCLIPLIRADLLPFYYDVGEEWVGTDYYIGNQVVSAFDRGSKALVEVGVNFSDQPFAVFASERWPMEFFMFPVGVFPDGTYESIVTEGLLWRSTNNFFGGEAGPIGARANAIDDGLDFTVLSGRAARFDELTPDQLTALEATGFINTVFVLAEIDISPKVINRRAKGRWVTASIGLPDGYSVRDIDPSTVVVSKINGQALLSPIPADKSDGISYSAVDGRELLSVKFARTVLAESLIDGADSLVTVLGRMYGGTLVEGTASVRVLK